MASLSTLVPTNYVLTSGVNSVMSWSNVLTLSTANCSTVNTSSIVTNSIGANVVTLNSTLSVSTLTARTVNYSSITGSSISTNAMTLSLTNVSTQNTQIYQVATTNPTTSYTVIQASHVSTGTTNNALVINPSGGNVGVGTTAPGATLQVSGTGILTSGIRSNMNNVISGSTTLTVSQMGGMLEFIGGPYTVTLPNPTGGASATNGYMTFQAWVNTSSAITFSTPSGIFVGHTGNGLSSIVLPNATNQIATFASDGYNWAVWLTVASTTGGAIIASNITMGITNAIYMYYIAPTNNAGIITNGSGDLSIFTGTSGVANRLMVSAGGYVNISLLNTNGTVITTGGIGQLAVSSDRRIKENIVYQSDTQQGLASVLNLKPATYRLIGQPDVYLGFIAQDVEQDIPLAVDGKKYEWQWETTEDGKPKFDANGDIVYKLDADGNRIVRPRGVSDRAIIATQTLAIQELAKQLTSAQQQLSAKSAALDSLIAWAQTMGYSASS